MEKKPTLLLSVIPTLTLITLLILGAQLFVGDFTSGPSQIALIGASIVSALIAMFYLKIPWKKLEEGMLDNLSKTGSAIFILLMIGALTAAWIQSGVVPTMIYYGLQLISPQIFLFIAFIFTGIVSIMAGSSWTTVGTIGVAMLTAGKVLGFHEGWLAGAIISGAYFGDKISPLSDTTNLSASVAGVDLYKHVRYLLITNIPTLIITGIVFAIAGFVVPVSNNLDVQEQCAQIATAYNISPWLLLIPACTIFMIYKKLSPYITLFLSAIIGAAFVVIAQPQIAAQITVFDVDSWKSYLYTPLKLLSTSVNITTGNEMLDGLVSTKGMGGMLNTIWLILCVVAFSGITEAAGFVKCLTNKMAAHLSKATSLVSATVGSCIACNIILSDQYIAILVSGKMFAHVYKDEGYEPQLLSRTLQDSATVTSVLVPWNTCGVAQSGVLGVSTLTYLPYCVFNILSPIMSILITATGYKIVRKIKK